MTALELICSLTRRSLINPMMKSYLVEGKVFLNGESLTLTSVITPQENDVLEIENRGTWVFNGEEWT